MRCGPEPGGSAVVRRAVVYRHAERQQDVRPALSRREQQLSHDRCFRQGLVLLPLPHLRHNHAMALVNSKRGRNGAAGRTGGAAVTGQPQGALSGVAAGIR